MSPPKPVGWDHPTTARAYREFQKRASRYREANRELVRHAALAGDLIVLDMGAGDGGTARAALPNLGADGAVLCVEPATAMRESGRRALRDPHVRWTDACPTTPGRFDRVLCGAAIWQMLPLPETIRRVRRLVRPGGCFCFDIPAAYLGEADSPGGGRDPHLLELMALLSRGVAGSPVRAALAEDEASPGWGRPDGGAPDAAYVEASLRDAGFSVEAWSFSVRVGQDDHREWLKIPPTTDGVLLGVPLEERVRRIERAFARVDRSAWKWERWRGWTAWAPGP